MRIFHGAGDGDDLQFSIPALLGILLIPSAFGFIQVLEQFSTLKHYLMGVRYFDVYRASFGDEYFFIVYSMVITGAVVILKWDRLFPDRQDFDNLAVLPISGRQNFMASLIALLFLTSLFAAIVNGAASLIFPFAVTASYNTLGPFVEFFIAHTVSVVLASFFVCFGLLVLMGVTILVTPKRYVRIASLAVRIAGAVGLAGLLATAFTLPRILQSGAIPNYVTWVPPVWFLDLHQTMLVHGTPTIGMGIVCLEITALTFVVAMIVYSLTYYREFMRIPERAGLVHASGRDSYSIFRRCLEAVAVRSAFQRATYSFSIKTLFRNDKHCLLFGTATAMGFFLSAQAAGEALADPFQKGIDPRLLSVSLTMAFFTIVSMRALFDVPSERDANWVFRSTVDRYRNEAREVAGKVLLTPIIVWLMCMLPVHVILWGWTASMLHSAYVLMCSAGLAQLLLLKFRKIPFTCAYTASKDRFLVMVILGLIGFSLFSNTNARIEVALLNHPIRFLFVIPVFVALIWRTRMYRQSLPSQERALVFEDRPAPLVQLLNLPR